MNFDKYQREARRTVNEGLHRHGQIANLSMGLAGEAGELIDALKKTIFHGHELDRAAAAEEIGDLLWYVAGLASVLDLSLGEIAEGNIGKLRERYPAGFDEERSRGR